MMALVLLPFIRVLPEFCLRLRSTAVVFKDTGLEPIKEVI